LIGRRAHRSCKNLVDLSVGWSAGENLSCLINHRDNLGFCFSCATRKSIHGKHDI